MVGTAAGTAAASAANRKIDRDGLARMVAAGVSTASIAACFAVTEKAVHKAKARWHIRTYPLLTDAELIFYLFHLFPAPGPFDGYRQIAGRVR